MNNPAEQKNISHEPMHYPMIPPDIPPLIVNAVVKARGIVAIRKLGGGLSGGTVAHCRAVDGSEYALKRWPSTISLERIEAIHRVITHAWNKGCETVALPVSFQPAAKSLSSNLTETVFSMAGEHWELSQWRPGKAVDVNTDLSTIRRGAEVIANFHECTASLQSCRQPAPIIQERLRILTARKQQFPLPMTLISEVNLNAEVASAIRDAANLLLWKWDEAHDQIHRSLSQYADCNTATQYVLRDVHAQHILFSAGRATGLVDFDAVRIDTPASDLARWAGSFLSGPHSAGDVWDAIFTGYQARIPQPSHSNEPPIANLATDLCFAGAWLSLANWLVWLLVERRDFEVPPGILAKRIYNLIQVATRLTDD